MALVAKAMAFGGVEIGSMKANEHASVALIICATGDTCSPKLISAMTGNSIAVAATFEFTCTTAQLELT
jgi:hypothetical protein